MKTKYLFIIILLGVICNACERMLDYPAFPDKLAQNYFPYTNGTILTFYNTKNDTLELTINNWYESEAYSVSAKWDCGSGSAFSFNATNDLYRFYVFIGIDNTYAQMSITIGSLAAGKMIRGENIYKTKNYEIFGDKVFLESGYSCPNATVIKGKGITEWTDGDGEVWKLIE